uniref:Fascin domain-containing protein n=1 Tax=Macrostomum lignano TaxID=282301 RepID=A0A1I8FHH0_9PLAT
NPWLRSLIPAKQRRPAWPWSSEQLWSNGGRCVSASVEDLYFLDCAPAPSLLPDRRTLPDNGELYVLEEASRRAVQGLSTDANASIRTGHRTPETYQLEFQAGRWRFRTRDDKFWRLSAIGTGISGNGEADPSTLFEMQPLPRGRVSLRCSNGAYLAAKKLGALNARRRREVFSRAPASRGGAVPPGAAQRPVLVFAAATASSGSDGYWSILGDASISFRSSRPEEFVFEFCNAPAWHPGAEWLLRAREQNGTVRADSSAITDNCFWSTDLPEEY